MNRFWSLVGLAILAVVLAITTWIVGGYEASIVLMAVPVSTCDVVQLKKWAELSWFKKTEGLLGLVGALIYLLIVPVVVIVVSWQSMYVWLLIGFTIANWAWLAWQFKSQIKNDAIMQREVAIAIMWMAAFSALVLLFAGG